MLVSDQVPNVGVTMAVADVPWNEVLEQLVHCVGAELGQDGNIIVIRPGTGPANQSECGFIRLSDQAI